MDFIPLHKVDIRDPELAEVDAVLRSGWLTTGPRALAFETEARRFLGCEHALAVTSGTAAMHLALLGLDCGPGDEVITTPMTFAATVNAILYVGATPVLADIDPKTLQLSPAAASERVTARTKAILVVHYGGAPADLEALGKLAQRHNLAIVEDAALAMGAHHGSARVGARSRAACFSFHPAKNMTTAEGGLLATCDARLAETARLRSWHGIDKTAEARREQLGNWYYEVQDLGYKYNMSDVQAAIGLHQLARIDGTNQARHAIADKYDAAFVTLPGVQVEPDRGQPPPRVRHPYWMVLDPDRYDRHRFIAALSARRIASGVHYIPIHLHPYYKRRFGWGEGLCPTAEHAYRGLVSLPLFPSMTERERTRVMEAVPAALAEAAR